MLSVVVCKVNIVDAITNWDKWLLTISYQININISFVYNQRGICLVEGTSLLQGEPRFEFPLGGVSTFSVGLPLVEDTCVKPKEKNHLFIKHLSNCESYAAILMYW